jgi:glycerophosphoryl diester phosphodiesterase
MVERMAADHPFFAQAKNRPEVIAHRGGNGQWPGETMTAYKEAVRIGVDVLEMDVYLTKDNQLALMHDIDIKKTTNGQGLIHKYTLAELQELNAAYNWSDDGTTFRYRKKPADLPEGIRKDVRVPGLKEVFEAFPQMRMVVEMKPALHSPADALCRLLREQKMTDKVLVASFVGGYMKDFRRLCPEVATSASLSLGDAIRFLTGSPSSTSETQGALAVEVPYQLITEARVNIVRQRNLKLHAWTVNQPADMNRMKALGVDGIITDYPGPLLLLLNRTQPG